MKIEQNSRLLVRLLLSIAMSSYVFPLLFAQNQSDDSVAAAAKKTREEKASNNHVTAKKVLNEETSANSNWSKRSNNYWATIPPSTLTISVPNSKSPAQDSAPGESADPYGAYILFGETIWNNDSFNGAANEYLRMLLTRSRYRGASLTIGSVEDTTIAEQAALLVHFKFDFRGVPHEGMALFVSAPQQVMSVGCMYRNIDWEKASRVCEHVMNTAEASVPSDYKIFRKPY